MPTDEQLKEHIKECERNYHHLRYGHERDWFRNLLYRQGHQWIVWDATGRHFRQKKVKSWVPTPVTNKFASILDALAALILRVEPSLQWRSLDPNDEPEKTKAETATQILERAKESTNFREFRQLLANWIVYTGNGYLVNYYDAAGGGTLDIPLLYCPQCGEKGMPSSFEQGCAQCGNSDLRYQLDDHGFVIEEQMQAGRVRTEVCSPFETYSDWTIPLWSNQREILIIKDRPLSYFKRYGGKGKQVQASGRSATMTEFYSNALAYMSSGSGGGPAFMAGNHRESAPEYWYVRMPDDDYPEGCYAILGGDVMLERTTLDPRNHKGEKFLPVTQFIMDPIPGSGLGRTVGNDLAPKQKQRNEVEALIQLIIMRCANPVWIVPFGTDVEGFNGQPGAVLKSIQIGPSQSGDPRRVAGENVPASVTQWLDKLDSDMEELASVFDLLKGNQPPGVTAGYALQLLIERGQSRWGPLFQRWENGMVSWGEQVTALERTYTPADQLIDMLGPHGEWAVTQFKSEALGRCTMQCEAGSARPTSSITEQALLDSLIPKGIIDMNPQNKAQILRSLGMSKYGDQSDYDMKDAAKEEQSFLDITKQIDLPAKIQEVEQMQDPQAAMQMQQQVQTLVSGALRFRPQIDDHLIHLWSHKKFAKTDKFMALPAEWQAVFLQHLEAHAQRIMQEQMMQAMGTGGAPQGIPASGPPSSAAPGGDSGLPPQPAGSTMEPSYEAASPKGGHRENVGTVG